MKVGFPFVWSWFVNREYDQNAIKNKGTVLWFPEALLRVITTLPGIHKATKTKA